MKFYNQVINRYQLIRSLLFMQFSKVDLNLGYLGDIYIFIDGTDNEDVWFEYQLEV